MWKLVFKDREGHPSRDHKESVKKKPNKLDWTLLKNQDIKLVIQAFLEDCKSRRELGYIDYMMNEEAIDLLVEYLEFFKANLDKFNPGIEFLNSKLEKGYFHKSYQAQQLIRALIFTGREKIVDQDDHIAKIISRIVANDLNHYLDMNIGIVFGMGHCAGFSSMSNLIKEVDLEMRRIL